MSASRVAKNYVYSLTYQLLILIVPLITTPYLARVLGAENVGMFSYARSIATYFVLVSTLGSALYAQREIAYCMNDVSARTRIFKEILLIRALLVAVVVPVYWALYARSGQYRLIYLALMLEIVASALDITWFFQGIEQFRKIAVRSMAIKVLELVAIFALVKTADDLPLYAFCYSVPLLAGSLILWFSLPAAIDRTRPALGSALLRMWPILLLFLPQVAKEIYTVLDKTMIGQITRDFSQVGYYEQAQKIVKLAMQLVTSLGLVMLSNMSAAFSRNDSGEIARKIEQSFEFVFFLGCPIMFGVVGVSQTFVAWFFGAGYEPVVDLMRVFAPVIVVIGLSNVMGVQYLLPTRQNKGYTISIVVGAACNLLLNLALIPRFQAMGAACAALASELLVTCAQAFYVRGQLRVRAYMKPLFRYLLPSAAMGALVWGLGAILPGGTVTIAAQVCAGVLFYLLALALMRDQALMRYRALLRGMLTRR